MLCRINIKPSLGASSGVDYLLDVPDELFMLHMASYSTFQPSQLSDAEFRRCRLIGLCSTMKYVGPADATTSNRKEDQ